MKHVKFFSYFTSMSLCNGKMMVLPENILHLHSMPLLDTHADSPMLLIHTAAAAAQMFH
jgi:hypothetical protein